ncbi:MAG TPA: hypothetical protein VKT53_02395 [Candidatus Acidoferrum sp.]|nr:hypothetical protein [Candidatus Acidoferrum sp.]
MRGNLGRRAGAGWTDVVNASDIGYGCSEHDSSREDGASARRPAQA